jgi:hypothetical protein
VSTVRAFFLEEAGECLGELKSCSAPARLDPRRAHAAARRLRGSAQLARYRPVADQARRLEARLKPLARQHAGDGHAEEYPSLAGEVAALVAALERSVDDVRQGRIEREPRLEKEMDQAHEPAVVEVAIDELEYRGEAALARALDLRSALEDAILEDEPAGPILDELFDLIRLGMG